MNLSELLNGKEGLRLEFKRELPEPDKLARLLVALTNTKGGYILIGFDEKKGEFSGIDPNQALEEKIMNIATTNCEPLIRPYIHYSTNSGKTIFIEIYDDRMEIISPGYLPGNLSSDNIIGNQYIRNRIIARRLFETGYVESCGTGLKMVVDEMAKQGGGIPLMIEENNNFRIILKSLL